LQRGWDFSAGGGLICGVWIFGWVEGIGGGLIKLPLLNVFSKGRNGKGSPWGV